MTKKNVSVVQNPENEVPAEILAEAIVDVSAAAQKLLNSKLSKRAVLVLIRDATGNTVGLNEIETILSAAADLKKRYVRP